jgi:hypothetical protein
MVVGRILSLFGLIVVVFLTAAVPSWASAGLPSPAAPPRTSLPGSHPRWPRSKEISPFAPITERTSLQLTNCSTLHFFCNALGESGQQDLVVVLRQTGTVTPRQIPASSYLVLQADRDSQPRIFNGKNAITFTPAQNGTPALVSVDLANALPADHYTGALVLGATSGFKSVDAPVEIDARDGPFLPLIVLLGAVLAGALISLFFEKIRPKVDFDDKASSFLRRVNILPAVEQEVFRQPWQQVLSERDTDLRTAEQHLTALARGIDALRRVRDAQDEAMGTSGYEQLLGWVQRIGGATRDVISAIQGFHAPYDMQVALVYQAKKDFADALQVHGTVQSLKRRAGAARGTGHPYQQFLESAKQVSEALEHVSPDPHQRAPDLAPLIKATQDAFALLEQAHGSPLPEPQGQAVAAGIGAVSALASLLGWPAVATDVGGQARMPFDLAVRAGRWLRPAVSIVVAVTLLAIGFKTTYLDNVTFGATVSDWVGLVIWGLAAYGARKALTGLGATPR